jgi:hypothetical protein
MRLNIVAAALVAAFGWGGVVGVVDAFSASSNANLAVYYGQNSRNIVGAQGNLAAYCQGIQCSWVWLTVDSTLDVYQSSRACLTVDYSVGVFVYLFRI